MGSQASAGCGTMVSRNQLWLRRSHDETFWKNSNTLSQIARKGASIIISDQKQTPTATSGVTSTGVSNILTDSSHVDDKSAIVMSEQRTSANEEGGMTVQDVASVREKEDGTTLRRWKLSLCLQHGQTALRM